MTEIKSTAEVDRSRPRLFFHATEPLENTVSSMVELGLLANQPTLTPSLEMASDFSLPGGGILTFWYPGKQEVQGKNTSKITPTMKLDKETIEELKQKVSLMGLNSYHQEGLARIIDASETLLPGSRMGAFAQANSVDIGIIASLLPDNFSIMIPKYANEKAELTDELLKALEYMKITYINPDLNKQVLAEDMIRTSLEHSLLSIARSIKYAQNLKRKKSVDDQQMVLNNVHFDEAVYERYRNMLLSAIERFKDS